MEKKIKHEIKILKGSNNCLREEVKKMMDRWAEVSKCEEFIHADSLAFSDSEFSLYAGEHNRNFFLFAGEEEVLIWKEDIKEHLKMNVKKHFADLVPISSLKLFIKKFPKMVEEITKKMKKNTNENINNILVIENLFKKEG